MVLRFDVLIDGKPYAAAWQEFLERRFKQLDADGDGVLTADEQRGLPSTQVLAAAGSGRHGPRRRFRRGFASAGRQDHARGVCRLLPWRRPGAVPRADRAGDPNAGMRAAPVVGRQQPADQAAKRAVREAGRRLRRASSRPTTFTAQRNALRQDGPRPGRIDLRRRTGADGEPLSAWPLQAARPARPPSRSSFPPPPANRIVSSRSRLIAALDGRGGEVKDNRLSFRGARAGQREARARSTPMPTARWTSTRRSSSSLRAGPTSR